MAKLLDAKGLSADHWTWVDADSAAAVPGPALYPIAFWLAHRDELPADSGIWLDVAAEPGEFADVIPDLALIAIRFGAFSDGRGLSLGVLLRNRYRFRGELRAIGDVHEDLVHYMHRCGFDSFVLEDTRDAEIALRAIETPRDAYQGSVRQPKPAFRRALRRASLRSS